MKAKRRPMQGTWRKMNRKQRRETIRKIQSEALSLEVIHPDAAGIDIGNESHYVAVPPSRHSQPVRRFGCTTAELKAMAGWLTQCGIHTIAMQSTGVYWSLSWFVRRCVLRAPSLTRDPRPSRTTRKSHGPRVPDRTMVAI